MKVVSVVAARPQVIKCAPCHARLRQVAQEVLVYKGQHYDDSMSGAFSRELGIHEPDQYLAIRSGSHEHHAGEMLKKIEEILQKKEPDVVLVYCDTNSTFAGHLAAAKPHSPVAHVEAELRSHNRQRTRLICSGMTDHLSALLLCPTETAVHSSSVPQPGM